MSGGRPNVIGAENLFFQFDAAHHRAGETAWSTPSPLKLLEPGAKRPPRRQVVSAPDARLLEVAAAYIELNAGGEVTAEELIAHCAARIASYKVPRYVRFVTEWPMSSTKVQKFRLRETLMQELGS